MDGPRRAPSGTGSYINYKIITLLLMLAVALQLDGSSPVHTFVQPYPFSCCSVALSFRSRGSLQLRKVIGLRHNQVIVLNTY